MSSSPRKHYLPVIVLAQAAGTSLWFGGNLALRGWQGNGAGLANLTSLVQFGFIGGTLAFSLFGLADRLRASRLFFLSSLFAAFLNLLIIPLANMPLAVACLRFGTGFFLAGIYPVGMKIAAEGLSLLWVLSAVAAAGGGAVWLLVPSRPVHAASGMEGSALAGLFREKEFRLAALGYFGHMWELYAFWAFLPLFLQHARPGIGDRAAAWDSFWIVAAGCLGCIAGGVLSRRLGSRTVALACLVVSGACCVASPWLGALPGAFFWIVLLLWGLTVVADSPQLSTLVARHAHPLRKGTALTLVTCFGFSITIASIQAVKASFPFSAWTFWILAPGPLLGGLALLGLKKERPAG